jgi:large subunit ribosomal protein L29
VTTAADFRTMSYEDLGLKLGEAKEELFNLRFQLVTNQLDNTARLTQVKRDIARIRTVMRELEIEAWEEQATEEES